MTTIRPVLIVVAVFTLSVGSVLAKDTLRNLAFPGTRTANG